MKRLLSLILAICMLVSLLPSIYAEETSAGITVKYDLSAAMQAEGMTTLSTAKAPSVIDYEDTNGLLDVVEYGAGKDAPDNNWRYYQKNTSADSDYNIVLRQNQILAMEIVVPESGEYKMIAHRGIAKADIAGDVEVYIYQGEFSDAYKWNVGTKLGRYNCAGADYGFARLGDATVNEISAEDSTVTTDTPATITLEAGKYVVAFERVGMTGYYGSVGGFSLVSGNGDGTVPVSIGNLTIKNKKASVQAILSDGSATDLGDIEVTYQSSDEAIAKIDPITGVITNIAAGDVTITATADVLGRKTSVSAAYNSVPPDPNGIIIKYDLNADIQKVADMKGWGAAAIVPYFTPELITSEITNGFYEYFNFTYKTFTSNSFYFRPGAKGFVTRDDSIASFKINVPKAGTYDLNVKHSANSVGLDVRVYISKDNYSTADADYVGTYSSKDPDFTGTSNFSSVNGATEKTGTIENVIIDEPGEYIITFQPQDATVGNWASWTYGAVGSFELVAGDKTVLMKARADYDIIPLGIGTEYALSATGILSDRTEVAMTLSDFTGYDDTIVSVSADGVVRGLRNGKTTVTYNAEYNGEKKQLSTDIEVGGKGISIKYNFGGDIAKLYGTEYSGLLNLNDFTYATSGGFFKFFKASRTVPVAGRFNAYRNFIGLSDGEYVTYEIFVPQAGTYSMTVEHGMYDQSLEVDVFVSDKGTSFSAEDRVGTYDCNRDGENNVYNSTTTTISDVMLPKAGTYYVTFQPTNRQDGNTSWYWGFIGDMTLKSGEEAVLAGIIQAEKAEENELVILGIDESSIEWTDVNMPATTNAYVQIKKVNGGEPVNVAENKRYKSSSGKIADVDADGLVTGYSDGTCQITVSAKVAGEQYSAPLNLSVVDNTGVASAKFGIPSALYLRQKAKAPIVVTMNSGNEVTVPAELVSYSYEPDGIVTIDNQGIAECIAVGETTITAAADFRGSLIDVSAFVITEEHEGKSEPTYFTYEKRENAANNIKKYSWAKAMRDSAVTAADKALATYEVLYDQLPAAGIPTSGHITKTQDPNWNICHYCGINLSEDYGNYSSVQWGISPDSRPWKIQCPSCKRLFPSNDFALLYERGRDERGHYDIDAAIAANAEAVKNGEDDALKNILYPEIADVDTINCGQGLRPGETVETWGVDAGLGYFPKDESGKNYTVKVGDSNVTEIHIYIPYYHLMLWSTVENAITNFSDAYVYTGDMRYGRAGAILLDRVADVWPEFDMRKYNFVSDHTYFLADASTGYGKVRGKISDSTAAEGFARATDALYPAIYDSAVINFLSEKANDFGLENDKTSSEKIWDNWADRILMETFESVQGYMIHGNFGWHQSAVAMAAVSLAQEPETTEMVEWLYRSGDERMGAVEGGNILSRLVDVVDRDGLGNEVADNYNSTWVSSIAKIADYLTAYIGDKNYNLYSHPKYVQMFMPYLAKTIVGKQSTNLGDSGATGSIGTYGFDSSSAQAFLDIYNTNNAGDEALLAEYAQQIYQGNNYSTKGLRTGIFDKDPDEIQDIINSYELSDTPLTRSDMLTGYGLAVLRAGNNYKSSSTLTDVDNQRDFWMYFGRRLGHGHSDVLGLGMDAFGFSISPDLGYPAVSGKDPETLQWATATIAHNTVAIDGDDQPEYHYSATPHHFDDSGFVKIVDAEANGIYKAAEQYRRTVVMVEVDDDISYGVDFFRVVGGDKHTFSFHGAAETVNAVSGLGEVTKQVDEEGNYIGSYAGPDIPVGPDPNSPDVWYYDTVYPRGYTWLSKVRRYNNPEQNFSVEFDIRDYRKIVKNNQGIKLRMTQMNNFTPDEVAFVGGRVPVRSDNNMFPKTLDYVLVQREGENLDSLFTTVYEPYRNTRYVDSISSVDNISIVSGSENADDTHNVVKVTHTSGRIDYIFYATNNTVKYKVVDGEQEIFFRGFVGVYTLNSDGKPISRYVNDGTIIGNDEAIAEIGAYNGTIKNFDEEFGFGDFENWIDVDIECDDTDALAGKYIYIENDGAQNGAYKIVSASTNDDGSVRLDLGAVSVVRSFANAKEIDGGYIYNIDVGQSFSIPLANIENNRPIFDTLKDISTSAGSSVNVKVHASSPIEGNDITYVGTALPRGAVLDSETGEFKWKPDNSQVGENHVAVTAVDSDGRTSTYHFTVEVFGSTTGGTGGGSGATTPSTDDKETTTTPDPENEVSAGSGETEGENVRFIDLGNHAWAADSINALADDGIIKGTTPNTYSPANNITRADFAILLVRAFGLTSDNAENFSDVLSTDYFASELAIARNTGIVQGIGDNKYAPRNTITRQDMMTIVHRVLTVLEVKLESGDVSYPDYDKVAPYAQDAVKALITSGIVNGKNGKIAPTDYTTRAEVAVLLKRILEYKNS